MSRPKSAQPGSIAFRASGNNGGACYPGPAVADALSSATWRQAAPMGVPEVKQMVL
jgi:hypothetical protein